MAVVKGPPDITQNGSVYGVIGKFNAQLITLSDIAQVAGPAKSYIGIADTVGGVLTAQIGLERGKIS
jgi:hypothetical protein